MSRMHNPELTPNARKLRRAMTPEERRLWYDYLHGYPVRFLRQKVIGSAIVDFYCHAAKLAVELDGSQHYESTEAMGRDLARTERIEAFGLTVLRFYNRDVRGNFEGVCRCIDGAVRKAVGEIPELASTEFWTPGE